MSTGMGLFLIVLLVFGVLVGGTTLINDRTTELESAKAVNQDLSEQLDHCQMAIETETTALKLEIEQKNHGIAQCVESIKQCKDEAESLMNTNAQCNAEVENLAVAIAQNRTEFDSLFAENAQHQAEVVRLKEQNTKLEFIIAESIKQLKDKDAKLVTLEEQLKSCVQALEPSPKVPVLSDVFEENGIAIMAMAFLGLMSMANLAFTVRERKQLRPAPQNAKHNADPNKVTITMDKQTYRDFIRYLRKR
jgi:seryl-tRNA synthetase